MKTILKPVAIFRGLKTARVIVNQPRARNTGIHNAVQTRLSAACARDQHYNCFSIHCPCMKCGHDKTRLAG